MMYSFRSKKVRQEGDAHANANAGAANANTIAGRSGGSLMASARVGDENASPSNIINHASSSSSSSSASPAGASASSSAKLRMELRSSASDHSSSPSFRFNSVLEKHSIRVETVLRGLDGRALEAWIQQRNEMELTRHLQQKRQAQRGVLSAILSSVTSSSSSLSSSSSTGPDENKCLLSIACGGDAHQVQSAYRCRVHFQLKAQVCVLCCLSHHSEGISSLSC